MNESFAPIPAIAPTPLVRADELTLGNPLFGLVCTGLGLALALITLPADVEPRGALRLPATLFAVCLCLVPVFTALHAPKSIFRAEHILVLAPIFWLLLDVIQGRYELSGVSQQDVGLTFSAIALFVGAVWVSAIHRPWPVPRFLKNAALRELSPNVFFGIAMLAFLLAFLRFAIPSGFDLPAMFASLGGGRWSAPWGRGDLGGTDAFLDHFSYFGYILPTLTVVLARRVGWNDFRTWGVGLAALIIVAFLSQGGGRRIVGVLFGSAAVLWFLGQPKVRIATVLIMAVGVLGLLTVLETMLDYRNVGFAALFNPSEFADELPSGEEKDALLRVDDNFLRLAQMTLIFPEYHNYTTWHYVLWVAVRPVPRLFWPGKPLDPGFNLPEFFGMEGVSLSSSVIGEFFMAGGFLGIALGGWFYGRLAGALSRLLAETGTPSALIVYSIGLLALFAGMRSMIELVLMSYGILAWAGLLWFARSSSRS